MWFTEDPWPPMLACGLGALLAVAFWSSTKRAIHLLVAAGLLVLGGVFYVVEQVIVTPGEQIERQVVELCDQFRRKDPATLDHFSNTAPELKLLCQTAMALVEIEDDLRITDLQTTLSNADSRAVCRFRANAGLSVAGFGKVGRQPGRFELTWAKESEGWKISKLRRLHPLRDEELPLMQQSAG
jgi:hypothetical protein